MAAYTLATFAADLHQGSATDKALNLLKDGKKHSIKATRSSLAKMKVKHTFALLFRLGRNLRAYTDYTLVFDHTNDTVQLVKKVAAKSSKSKPAAKKPVRKASTKKVVVVAGSDDEDLVEDDTE
jgi:hypothetical protein